MIKYIGLAIVSAVCLICGFDGVKRVRMSAKNTESVLKLVRHIESEILYRSPPLDEIYSSFDDDNFREQGITAVLCEKGIDSVIDGISHNCDDEAVKTVRAFCDELGTYGRDGQISLCQRTAEQLDRICRRVSSDAPKKAKVYLSLCICILLTALIIIV